MTKKTFLEKLEKKLSVLNVEEKKDIINEYKGIIEEKIKHGMKEEEAVADFGNFDEFVSEILSAYKIDPHINEEKPAKEKAQDLFSTGEEFIKEGAKKLSDATEKLVTNIKESNNEITIELIFELLLKGLCALIIMGFLTLPFLLLSHLGSAIFEFVLFPLDHVLKAIWKIIISLFYLATCAFLIVNMFKGYIKSPNGLDSKHKSENSKKSTKTREHKTVQSERKKEEKKVIKNNTESSISNLIIMLLKLFIIFFFLFPIWVLIIVAFIFLAILFYFLLKGVGILGLIICTMSGIAFLILLSHILYNGIFHNVKVHIYPFLITLVFAVVGVIMTFDYFTSFDYIDAAPTSHINKKGYITELTKPISIDEDFVLVIDNTIEDGKALIEVSYYDDFIDIEKEEVLYSDKKEIQFSVNTYDYAAKKIYKLFIENLKQNKFYNYGSLDEVSIVVKVNANTQNLVLND